MSALVPRPTAGNPIGFLFLLQWQPLPRQVWKGDLKLVRVLVECHPQWAAREVAEKAWVLVAVGLGR